MLDEAWRSVLAGISAATKFKYFDIFNSNHRSALLALSRLAVKMVELTIARGVECAIGYLKTIFGYTRHAGLVGNNRDKAFEKLRPLR